VLRLPASNNPEVFAAQKTLLETWKIVGEAFVDPEFNHVDWPEELRAHMMAQYGSADKPEVAWRQINDMLKDLGDPYTRRIEPDEYAQFRVSADGELQGVGLLIANEASETGHLRVLAPIRGGPADRAGIQPGDEVVAINGQDTAGWSGDMAAKHLRGRGGTAVHIKLARRTDGIPGVPGRPEPLPTVQFREVDMQREAVSITPVYATMLNAPDGQVGYVRLTQFSNNAPADMKDALTWLEAAGADRYILDLRANPGGLVDAGIEVAALWLDGEAPVFTVASRGDDHQLQTTETSAPALTHDPLVVLVDGNSASASEILTGALRDSGRAVVMGESATYGKGRIQSVFELQDGSALFVTVAKYQTPNGQDIDHRGILPDRTCRAPLMASAPPTRAALKPVSQELPAAAPGVDAATGFVPGVPLDESTEKLLLAALREDKCVLAAEKYFQSMKGGKDVLLAVSPDPASAHM